MPNSPRGALRGAKFPQCILLGGSNSLGYLAWGCQIPHDTGLLTSANEGEVAERAKRSKLLVIGINTITLSQCLAIADKLSTCHHMQVSAKMFLRKWRVGSLIPSPTPSFSSLAVQ